MASNRENFKEWFADVLALLYPHRAAGFAIVMVTMPLLEGISGKRSSSRCRETSTKHSMGSSPCYFPSFATW